MPELKTRCRSGSRRSETRVIDSPTNPAPKGGTMATAARTTMWPTEKSTPASIELVFICQLSTARTAKMPTTSMRSMPCSRHAR